MSQQEKQEMSLPDLDDLLGESVALADAKRNAKQGRKLTQEQAEILEANHIAEELELWQPMEVYAHTVAITCRCGNCLLDFRGWYALEVRKDGKGRRLVRRDSHEGLPAMGYTTELTADWCAKCAPEGLDEATVEDCELLEELEGSPMYEAVEEEEAQEIQPDEELNGEANS